MQPPSSHSHDYKPSGIIPHNQRPLQVMTCGCGDVRSAYIPLPDDDSMQEPQQAPPRILVPQLAPAPAPLAQRRR